ncbi:MULTISPECIES: hypothetical protein [Bacillales]|uniref:Uncharacterized protein n=2 Tax=Bacillales TaxID=1385 RepID=A0A6N8CR10_9BACI|nr:MULTISPECIES: hypothetical protein [Bacillales]MTT31627.1 hypothetical protein [Terrilactibacillus tamarindi]GAY76796.1 hypothetical protein NBRC111894_2350 [Sporolactobacillus inulinus]GEB76748.1 hypothetical protein SIN01_10930 [Sporolactobacillus inulinus]
MTKSKDEKAQPGTLAWQKQKIREEYVCPILEKENESMRTRRGSKRNLFNKRTVRTEF